MPSKNGILPDYELSDYEREDLDHVCEAAAILFRYYGWSWHDNPAPNEEAIRQAFMKLLNKCFHGNNSMASSGRLTVHLIADGDHGNITWCIAP